MSFFVLLSNLLVLSLLALMIEPIPLIYQDLKREGLSLLWRESILAGL